MVSLKTMSRPQWSKQFCVVTCHGNIDTLSLYVACCEVKNCRVPSTANTNFKKVYCYQRIYCQMHRKQMPKRKKCVFDSWGTKYLIRQNYYSRDQRP